jgi:hypothetical protein
MQLGAGFSAGFSHMRIKAWEYRHTAYSIGILLLRAIECWFSTVVVVVIVVLRMAGGRLREAGAGGRALGQGDGEACAGGCSPQF